MTEQAATCQQSSCQSNNAALNAKIGSIKHTFIVMSGKGGVGKSTVSVNLALSLSMQGLKTGILDVDIHGPSVPKMLGLANEKIKFVDDQIVPQEVYDGLKVISMGFLLNSSEDAVILRGPAKAGIIRQFFENVAWGDLDCLVVDCPPGTGDEPLSVVQLLDTAKSSAVIVTTPQQLATIDVEKSIDFCRQLKLPINGIVENMSGFICPHCHAEANIFSAGGGYKLAQKFVVPFLGTIPIDPDIARSGDEERPYLSAYPTTETAARFGEIVERLRSVYLELRNKPEADSCCGGSKAQQCSEPGECCSGQER
ncbi:Mrp/NBP35 family ATP-binding protein [Geobacter sp. FeAm09]|uniref:Mrp/NBP35 family ATP-binding protein n=1 Tax=Geobacter sp. FeAm09 TaxID=2597769 RepID=UPI0011EF3E7E|nr:Mrp/NBP35 family ATP-binding protein [Geobacter sp. FeAm09]QEM68866.1 Mrp/NBP35 family ATP-binding protein [Geobacter sp. FeAm09]